MRKPRIVVGDKGVFDTDLGSDGRIDALAPAKCD
jgi:hypothetical protein